MQGHDVIGASTGGAKALTQLVTGLPHDLDEAIFIVLHLAAHTPSVLPKLLNRRSSIPARHPADGEEIRAGTISVAPSELIRKILLSNDDRTLPGEAVHQTESPDAPPPAP